MFGVQIFPYRELVGISVRFASAGILHYINLKPVISRVLRTCSSDRLPCIKPDQKKNGFSDIKLRNHIVHLRNE